MPLTSAGPPRHATPPLTIRSGNSWPFRTLPVPLRVAPRHATVGTCAAPISLSLSPRSAPASSKQDDDDEDVSVPATLATAQLWPLLQSRATRSNARARGIRSWFPLQPATAWMCGARASRALFWRCVLDDTHHHPGADSGLVHGATRRHALLYHARPYWWCRRPGGCLHIPHSALMAPTRYMGHPRHPTPRGRGPRSATRAAQRHCQKPKPKPALVHAGE